MKFKVKAIRLSAIDLADTSFRVTTESRCDDLVRSLKTVGLINPPLLIPKDSSYTVVYGFRRIAACQRIGFSAVDARVADSDHSRLDCVKLAITDNAIHRTLNLVEVSRALNLLTDSLDSQHRLSETAKALGLPDNLVVIDKIKKISRLPWPLQESVISGGVSLPMALVLGDLETDTGNRLAKLFQDLNLSLNKQREIIELIKEIALRDGISIKNLLEENDVQKIINNKDLDRTRITKQLRTYLKKRRFPAITRSEAVFQKYITSLKLTNMVKMVPPKYFEGNTYTIQLHFKDIQQLKSCHKTLDKIIRHPGTKTVFD